MAVESTANLLEMLLSDSSPSLLRLSMSMTIVRVVNGFVDQHRQNDSFARSISQIAHEIAMPRKLPLGSPSPSPSTIVNAITITITFALKNIFPSPHNIVDMHNRQHLVLSQNALWSSDLRRLTTDCRRFITYVRRAVICYRGLLRGIGSHNMIVSMSTNMISRCP